MKFNDYIRYIGVGAFLIAGGFGSFLNVGLAADDAEGSSFHEMLEAPENKKIFGEYVRDYIMENPKVIRDAWQAFTAREEQRKRDEATESITVYQKELFESANGVVIGNPDGDVTIVEFFDYNCGYCRRAARDLDQLINDDPNLRVVLKEWPILGDDSIKAHEVAVAVAMVDNDLYLPFHMQLLSQQGKINKDIALQVADDVGVDMEILKEKMEENLASDVFQESFLLTGVLGINGTPAYVLKDEIISGAVGVAALKSKIANLRSCGSSVCN